MYVQIEQRTPTININNDNNNKHSTQLTCVHNIQSSFHYALPSFSSKVFSFDRVTVILHLKTRVPKRNIIYKWRFEERKIWYFPFGKCR